MPPVARDAVSRRPADHPSLIGVRGSLSMVPGPVLMRTQSCRTGKRHGSTRGRHSAPVLRPESRPAGHLTGRKVSGLPGRVPELTSPPVAQASLLRGHPCLGQLSDQRGESTAWQAAGQGIRHIRPARPSSRKGRSCARPVGGYSCQPAVSAARSRHCITPGPFGSPRWQNCSRSAHLASMAAWRTGHAGTALP